MMKFKIKKIPLPHQQAAINQNYPTTEVCRIDRRKLVWIGLLKPTPLSETYNVKIVYELGEFPKVWVINPVLIKRSGVDIPHMYSQERLCLFLPGEDSWRSDKLIANTIMPWISEWLYFYEIWHATGKWLGGGVHPTRPKKETKDEN